MNRPVTIFTIRIALFAIVLLLPGPLPASWHRELTYFLHGKIGGREIAMQLDEYGGACSARYFTPDDRFDHVMEGGIPEGGRFELASYSWDPDREEWILTDSLVLVEYEMNKWKGTWRYLDGTVKEFSLRPINIDSLNHPYRNAIRKYHVSPYAAFRTRDIRFTGKGRQKIGRDAYIQHVSETETGLTWFRVMSSSTIPSPDSINNRLIADHINAVNTLYSCVYLGTRGDYSLDYKVHFLNAKLISYTMSLQSSCYGRQEKPLVSGLTIRIADAKSLIPEEIFWFGDQPRPELRKGEYHWFQYRYNVFGPKILGLLTELYPGKLNPAREGECDYGNVKIWEFPEWYLTQKGLYMGSRSPVPDPRCDGAAWSLIPYNKLASYMSDDYGLIK